MSSVLRPVRKRKKVRTLGPVDIIRREDYADLEVDAKVELIRSLVPAGFDARGGGARRGGDGAGRRALRPQGRIDGGDAVTAVIPGRWVWRGSACRFASRGFGGVAGSEIPLRSYAALHGEGAVNDLLLKRVLYGISCRNYEAAAEAIPGAIGLSGSTVSRGFIEASAAKLRELQERDLAGEDVVAMVLAGKTFADATMVIALGMTISGEKRFLGFVETDTENAQVLTPFLPVVGRAGPRRLPGRAGDP